MSEGMKVDAQRIRSLREARGWSQEQLAAVSGLSARTIQRVESDGRVSGESRMALAAALGTDSSNLAAAADVADPQSPAWHAPAPFFDRSTVNVVLFLIGLVVALYVALWPLVALPTFRESFFYLEEDLPWLTRSLLEYPAALLVLPSAVVATWFLWPAKTRRGLACLSFGVIGGVVGNFLIVYALSKAMWM